VGRQRGGPPIRAGTGGRGSEPAFIHAALARKLRQHSLDGGQDMNMLLARKLDFN
jgi:hypothetical protein